MQLGLSTLIVRVQFALFLKGLHQTTASDDHSESYEISSEENLSVQTPGCIIPSLELMDTRIRSLVHYPENVPDCRKPRALIESNRTHLWMVKENLQRFDKVRKTKLECCYTPMEMSVTFRGPAMSYQNCVPLNDTIVAAEEFVRVTCNGTSDDFFTFIPKKPFTPLRIKAFGAPDIQPMYNVLILGLSSMSRLNFRRTMPNTFKLLERLGGIEMMGYSKVSEHTISNVLALLLGLDEHDLKRTCWPKLMTTIDRCPFIWERFKDSGYYTALLEDSARYSIFNLYKSKQHGLQNIPTDYYIYPFIKEAEKLNPNCMANKYYFQKVLDYLDDLTNVLRSQKLFGVFWESSMTIRKLNNAMLMDHKYESFLNKLYRSEYLNNTIVILLSEQGLKYGEIHATEQGRLEERLPLLYFLIPPSFAKNYSFAYENLKRNSRRLSTPYDVHDTLIDLLDLDAVRNDEVYLRSQSNNEARSLSLFLAAPNNRTCGDVKISRDLCTCLESRALPQTTEILQEASKFLIQHINEMVSPYTQCAQYKSEKVIKAAELFVTNESDTEWRDILLTVRASPGGGEFEATVRYTNRENLWSVVSLVKRVNVYSEQSHCVNNIRLKMYCYCYDTKDEDD